MEPSIVGALRDPEFRRDVAWGLLDAVNRGVTANALGAPIDAANGLLNAGKMTAGYVGHKLGLLDADDMPQPTQAPFLGSEWWGEQMRQAGIVSGNRNPVAEALAGFAVPAAWQKAGPAVYAVDQAVKPLVGDALERFVVSTGGRLYAMDPKAQRTLVWGLEGPGNAQRYRLGDIKPAQAAAVARYDKSAAPSTLDVYVSPSAEAHVRNARIVQDGFTPEQTGSVARQAMRPDSTVMPPKGFGDYPALVSPQMLDPITGRRYNATMPLRPTEDGFELVTVIPDGLAAKNKTPKK